MNLRSRMTWLHLIVALALPGCSETTPTSNSAPTHVEIVRVRLLQDLDHVALSATANPRFTLGADRSEGEMRFPADAAVTLALAPTGWTLGNLQIGGGVLTLKPSAGGLLSVNHQPYRGSLRFVPVSGGKFDVVNDVDVDDYLKGVLARELYPDWKIEAYKAQAIVARTYALYIAHTEGANRYWDLFPDQRSQVYGGLAAETEKSREAVETTAGYVLTYGEGEGKLFKAYFSSCCGGATQAASDAFPGEAFIPPLSEQDNHARCSIAPHFNWGPVTVKKDELTRRFRLWGARRQHPRPETTMAAVYKVDVDAANRFGRPTSFKVTDVKGATYRWSAEEMRSAVNTDAAPGTTLFSGYCKVKGNPNRDAVVFYDGHGYGHGVGMCQWCAEERAAEGESHERIVLAAFPGAKLVQAY